MRVRDARWMVLGVLAMTAASGGADPGGGQPAAQPPRPALDADDDRVPGR